MRISIVLALVIFSFVTGCTAPRGPYAPLSEADRDTAKAERLTREAAAIIKSNPARAEELLREALEADLYHGPAHNNLGVIYLDRGELFLAAGEFQWSSRLMPNIADPRLNLALVLEKAGRIDEAIAGYESALEVQAEHLPTLQALARAQVRYQRRDVHTPDLLRQIALRSDTQWRDWARRELNHLDDRPEDRP